MTSHTGHHPGHIIPILILKTFFLLTSINEGYYASITARLSGKVGNFLDAVVSFTRSIATEYGLEGGSQAARPGPPRWYTTGTTPEIGFSRFDRLTVCLPAFRQSGSFWQPPQYQYIGDL
jgi:hypothetical protein